MFIDNATTALDGPRAIPQARADHRLSAVLAAALGVVILFGAAFAPVDAVHNAAHDTRHAAAFPCH